MKPFNLEEYLQNPSKKVVTKGGRNVRIICTDRKGEEYPIVALIEGKYGEVITCNSKDGKYILNDASDCDLFFALEKKEGWVNVFKDDDGNSFVSTCIFNTKEDALKEGVLMQNYIATTKIEFEE